MVTVLVVILVAKKVWDSLPLILCSQWKASSSGDQDSLGNANGSMNAEESASPSMDDEWFESLDAKDDKLPEMYLPLNKSILKSVKLMDKELKLHPTIDCFCSGTTAVTLEKQVRLLESSNAEEGSSHCKTNQRLPVYGYLIMTPRVWQMPIAFGDFCLKDFGLISIPDICYRCLTEKDEFIILATDGVWDVLSNKEAVEVVASAPSHATAAGTLVDCAVRHGGLSILPPRMMIVLLYACF